MDKPAMEARNSIFDKNYDLYMAKLQTVSFEAAAPVIGGHIRGDSIEIPFFAKNYTVSKAGVTDASGKRPAYDVCIVLLRYILMCPDEAPKADEWVAYRDFRDSGPLTVFFSNDVERPIARHFTGNIEGLKASGAAISGYPPELDVNYDAAMQFDALPRIPMVMLFNDADDAFPATCSVLFERRAEAYLDAECLAIVGVQLFKHLTAL